VSLKIKTEFEKYFFYNGTEELSFDPVKHVYVKDGCEIPSVTKIVKIIDKSNALIPWAAKVVIEKLTNSLASVQFPIDAPELFEKILAAKSAHKDHLDSAGDIGKKAHDLIEKYIKHRLSPASLMPELSGDEQVDSCFLAMIGWEREHSVLWISTEKKIYSREYNYAGTLDGLAYCDSCQNKSCCPESFERRLSLIDWKSSNYLYPEYMYQTAAYVRAIVEEFPDQIITDRWIVQLGKEDGRFNPWHIGMEYQAEDFDIFRWCLYLTRAIEGVKIRLKSNKKSKKKRGKNEE
jgi:hypothetical protein